MTDSHSPETSRRYVRLTSAQWAEIEALWLAGDVVLSELSERYGVSRRALQNHFQKHGIRKGERASMMAAAVREEVLREELGDRDLKVRRAKDIAETAYANATVVEQLIMAQLKAAQEDPSQALRAASAIKGLSLAAAGLERLHDLKKRALGLDKMEMHDDLPDLRIHCLTDEEEDAIRRGQKNEACDWDDTPDDALAGVSDDGSLDEELDANEIIEEGVE